MGGLTEGAEAVKTIIVKGLGKIKFPASMADDEIAGIIKRHAELDMSEAARMARAETLGYDINRPLFHGGADIQEMKMASDPGAIGRFDGLFASTDKSKASSLGFVPGGERINEFFARKGKIASHHDIDYEHSFEELNSAFKKATGYDLDSEEGDLLSRFVTEDKDVYGASDDTIDAVKNLVSHDDDVSGDLGWEMQRIRGRLAKELGYDAVAMNDERGISYLIPTGGKARKSTASFNPELAFSDNILASAAPAAVGLGLLSSLVSPKSQASEQRAVSRLAELGQSQPTGTIQAAQHPLLSRAANLLLKFQTPIDTVTGPQFQNSADYLNKLNYGDNISYWDRVKLGLDWM